MPAARVPVRVADCFLMALSAFMRRTGQGQHIAGSVLELDRTPDIARLRAALVRVVKKHPLLTGSLRRDWRTWLPFWQVSALAQDPALPMGLWCEPGASVDGAVEVRDGWEKVGEILGQPLPDGFNAHVAVIARRGGTCYLLLAWTHLIIDGKGAELLLAELAALCEGVDSPCDAKDAVGPATTWSEKIKLTKPAIYHLETLAKTRIRSLAGPRPRGGACRYQVIALDEASSARVLERVERMTGALFPLGFFVACAARAHDRVLADRGTLPEGYMTSVPIQTRKRGARGPLFHNHVTVLFLGGPRAQLASLETAAAALKQQFSDMMRGRLDESFTAVLELMMRLPSRLFMFVVRRQFRGEICSFFQSHTGSFAPELARFSGARVLNAFHLPGVSAPPGTGVFFSEHGHRLNVTLSWREDCLNADERRTLAGQILEDLLGQPCPDLVDAGL